MEEGEPMAPMTKGMIPAESHSVRSRGALIRWGSRCAYIHLSEKNADMAWAVRFDAPAYLNAPCARLLKRAETLCLVVF